MQSLLVGVDITPRAPVQPETIHYRSHGKNTTVKEYSTFWEIVLFTFFLRVRWGKKATTTFDLICLICNI